MLPDKPLNLRLLDMPFEDLLALQDKQQEFRTDNSKWPEIKAIIAQWCDWTVDELTQLSAREVRWLLKAIRQQGDAEEEMAIPPQFGIS